MEFGNSKRKLSEKYLAMQFTGHGKTSIMAKAASLVRSWLDGCGNRSEITVLRFLGTTPQSSSVSSLLAGLCDQIVYTSSQKRYIYCQ